MFSPLAVTHLRKPTMPKATDNFKYHHRDATTFVLSKIQPCSQSEHQLCAIYSIIPDGIHSIPLLILRRLHALWWCCRLTALHPPSRVTVAEKLFDTRGTWSARWIWINPVLLPYTAKKGLMSSSLTSFIACRCRLPQTVWLAYRKISGMGTWQERLIKKTQFWKELKTNRENQN